MIHLIQSVSTRGFVLICHYSSGEIVEYDMGDVLQEKGRMSQPLKEPNFFDKVFVESGTPTWPNGYDVCPEVIYKDGKHINRLKKVS